MCYEFVHNSDSPLVDHVNRIVSVDKYFLFSLGKLNYLYSEDTMTVSIIADIMGIQDVALQDIPKAHLVNMINAHEAKEFKSFHGSVMLYSRFINDHSVK